MKSMSLGYAIVLLTAVGCHGNPPTRVAVEGEDFVADFFFTGDSAPRLGVLVLGGSEGGKPEHSAVSVARLGYPVLSLAYFKAEGRPEHLDMIPLEYFERAIAWLQRQEQVKGGGIAVRGGSRGAELALLLAARLPEVKGVIALAPSSVAWQAFPTLYPPRSSWSVGGEAIPFVAYDVSKGFQPDNLVALFRHSLTDRGSVARASIEVEKIGGRVLLLSGSDDKIWPSAEMAESIRVRLERAGFLHSFESIVYPDAGTLFQNTI